MTIDSTISSVGADGILATVIADRYRLVERVGAGASGTVFRATDLALDRDVAIKLFHRDGGDLRIAEQQAAEIRVMSRLRHPTVVPVFDAGVIETAGDTRRWVALEFVAGRTLRAIAAGGGIPSLRAAEVGLLLANALAHVHALGIVHRDIKPDNVLVDTDDGAIAWTVRLTDFGVATTAVPDTTSGAAMIGTAGYLSPEQVRGEAVGPASDVYSLGLVLLEALTGERGFDAPGIEGVLVRLNRGPRIPERLDPRWRDVTAAMTRMSPAERPGLDEIAALLRDIVRHPRTPVAVPQAMAAVTHARAGIVTLITVSALVAGVAFGVLLGVPL